MLVHFLPTLVEPDQLRGRVVIVIDVLRATTTIAQALAAGAERVVPCLDVEEARRIAQELGGTTLLGGERGGRQIPGFDLGNSPAEYTSDRVAGRTIVFTTTNGTRAMLRCRQATRLLMGAFVNRAAVLQAVHAAGDIDIVCAGTDGVVTREDVLLAGSFVAALTAAENAGDELNDQAHIARDAWRSVATMIERDGALSELLGASRGGRNLIAIGQQADIQLAAQVDCLEIVPELDVPTWSISAR